MPPTRSRPAAASVRVALDWARSKVGVREQPPGSGRGPEIDEWQQACGLLGYPWCGAFVATALRAAGLTVGSEIVWIPTLLDWARAGDHGFSLHEWDGRAAGDLVLFKFGPNEREVDHVGLLDTDLAHTIEGNTSADGNGARLDGGVVARRARGGAGVVGCARPTWP